MQKGDSSFAYLLVTCNPMTTATETINKNF